MAYDGYGGPEQSEKKKPRRLSKAEEADLVKEVRDNIEEAYNHDRDNRTEAEIDLQFVAGDQWPQAVKQARGTARPMLTINQLPQFVHQVTNPTRTADIAIKASPVDDATDPEMAKIYNGLIKQIEYQSNAKAVYVAGNEHQAMCGIGWWQVATRYVDDAIFDQEICLKRVENPLSVFCDPAAVLPDRSDAMWIAIVEMWPKSLFKRKFPKAVVSDVDVPGTGNPNAFLQWATQDTVAVAMYFCKKPVTKTLALTMSGKTLDITGKGEAELGQLDMTDPIVQTRECHTHRVEKYLVNGTEVLEGPIDWPGKYIPLVPVLGAEIPTKSGTLRYGVVRFCRDPQQLLNFYRTAAAETIALAPKAPYLATPKQIGAHKGQWDTANTENRTYMFYNPDPEAPGPPKREHPPETPVALVQQGQIASDDLNRTSGVYPAAVGETSNETSGIAIRSRVAQGDNANSHLADNLVHSLTYTGRILIDLIPRIYDNERVMRLLDENGEEFQAPINMATMGLDGQPVMLNDLSAGRFDVRVTVGKNYATKRIEAINALMEFAKSMPPETQILFADLIAKNSDWPGAEEISKRLRNMIPPQALADPNDPNAPQPPGPMDDPAVVAQLEEMAAKIDKLKAETEKIRAEIAKVPVDTTKVEADTYKVLAETENLEADTDHNIVIPSVTGELPSPVQRAPTTPDRSPGQAGGNGASASQPGPAMDQMQPAFGQ